MWSGLGILDLMLGNMGIYFSVLGKMMQMVFEGAVIITSPKIMAEVIRTES